MRLGRTTAAVVVGIAVLAGCSNGSTANETLPPISSSAAPASEALQPLGPADYPMPPEARRQDANGAKSFLAYYIGLMNYSTAHLSTDSLRDLGVGCAACNKFADGLEQVAAAQQMIRGAEFSINGSSAPLLSGATAEFSLSLTQRSSQLLSTSGDPLPGYEQEELTYPGSGALLTWQTATDCWTMTELSFQ
jgi:hypothetical protein